MEAKVTSMALVKMSTMFLSLSNYFEPYLMHFLSMQIQKYGSDTEKGVPRLHAN
jgi:hypothetical protein